MEVEVRHRQLKPGAVEPAVGLSRLPATGCLTRWRGYHLLAHRPPQVVGPCGGVNTYRYTYKYIHNLMMLYSNYQLRDLMTGSFDGHIHT